MENSLLGCAGRRTLGRARDQERVAEARSTRSFPELSGIPETRANCLKDKDSGIPEEKVRADAEAAPVKFPFI